MPGENKWFLGCGAILLAVVIFFTVVGVWLYKLSQQPESGVKYSNEMDKYALRYLEDHKILMPSEELIAYYDETLKMTGTEAAILTNKRVIYHKDGNTTAIKLTDITDVTHQKVTLAGDIIEIKSSSGKLMSVEIAPLNDGEKFLSALMDAWKRMKPGAETGAPKTKSH